MFPLVVTSVGCSSGTSSLTQLRGHFPLHLSVSVHPVGPPFPSPRSYRAWGSSLRPRQPQALIIAPLRQPVALKSTPPPPSLARCPPPSPSSPLAADRRRHQDIEVLLPGSQPKRQCIRQTYGHAFKILSLFNRTHQSNARFLSGAGGRAEAALEDRCWRKISMFLFSGCVKVITRARRGSAERRKMRRVPFKGCAQTHQAVGMSDYTK